MPTTAGLDPPSHADSAAPRYAHPQESREGSRLEAGKPIRVVHLTSVHRAFDVRIFHKECRTLAASGYDVTLVAPHDRDETRDGVVIRAVRQPRSRRERFLYTGREIYKTCMEQDADVYHFHDPELMPVAILLKLHGKRVVYDVHEDYPAAMYDKHWLPRVLRPAVATGVRAGQAAMTTACDQIVAATPAIATRFSREKTTVVQNFPWREEFASGPGQDYQAREPIALYAGGIAPLRGLREMLSAIIVASRDLPAKLVLAGPAGPDLQAEIVEAGPAVEYRGMLGRSELAQEIARARMGLVLFHPCRNHLNSQPNKLFEYMSAGLPIIASDFPLWRELVCDTQCGLLVDPLDPAAIADAITWILRHPQEAEQMGRNGRRAVAEKYNWERESANLLAVYAAIGRRTRA